MFNQFRIVLISLLMGLTYTSQAQVWAWEDKSDVIGQLQIVVGHSSINFAQLAEKYDVAFSALVEANPGVDPWHPEDGVELTIPTQHVLPSGPRTGIVINTAEYRLYYFDAKHKLIYSYPTGIGRPDWPTPLGDSHVVGKIINPSWTVPESILAEAFEKKIDITPIVPPGPDNPLGDHAIKLSMPSILIHGTNSPAGVGRRVTHGCMRLYPTDVSELYNIIDKGLSVRIVHEPIKAGWRKGDLYVEMHQPLPEYQTPLNQTLEHAAQLISNHAQAYAGLNLDWGLLGMMANNPTGLPTLMASKRKVNLMDVRREIIVEEHTEHPM